MILYDSYVFKFYDIHPSGNNTEFDFCFLLDGGSSYGLTKTTTAFYALHNEADSVTAFTYIQEQILAQGTQIQ